jgi:hypothetical protein
MGRYSLLIIRSKGVPRAALALIVVALTLAGCRSGGDGSPPTVRALTSTSSAPAPSAAAAQAVAAYQGMWKAFVEAAKAPDPDAPDLRRYATDDALKLIVSSLVVDRDQGKVIKGTLVTNPAVTNLQPPNQPVQATIADCVDDTNWLEYKRTGELWDNQPGGRHRTTATVKVIDGVWKVSSFALEAKGTC